MGETEVGAEVTLGEIGRRLDDLVVEFRAFRGELVRGDVYAADRKADELRFKAIEGSQATQAEDRTSLRRLVYGAFLSLGSAIVVLVLTLTLGR